jgi:hypothetical protein
MKTLSILFCTTLITQLTFAQSITGSWYGRADAVLEGGTHNNYLTELILKQKGDEVEGIFGYYFKNMYQSFFVRGKYNKNTRQLYIKNIPVIHFRASSSNEMDCPMEFEGTLVVSKAKSTLRGFFYRPEKYKYTCPDLRVTYTLDGNEQNQDSLLRTAVAMQKIWAPLPEDVVVANNNATTTTDNNGNISTEDQTKTLIDKFEARKNIVQKEIFVNADSVRVSFYDNGDIDGDSISVFINGVPVLSKKELDVKGLNLYVKLDSTKEINEISMFADNLGKYPPNTALMVVFDGETRYELYLSSSLTQNSTVRIRRK